MKWLRIAVWVGVLGACPAPSAEAPSVIPGRGLPELPPSRRSDGTLSSCPSLKGDPTQFRHSALAQIDGPIFCGEGAFIRVHGRAPKGEGTLRGRRKIEMGHPAAETACKTEPTSPDACPVIFADAFGEHVMRLLIARGIPANGVGLGACGSIAATYDGWNFSVAVDDWAHADVAVGVIQEELDRWGIDGHFGLSIRPNRCAVAQYQGQLVPQAKPLPPHD
jgi:hypothetical protein